MTPSNNRILIVDDNQAIHQDFQKILAGPQRNAAMAEIEAVLFNQKPENVVSFELTSAFQGAEAIDRAEQAQAAGQRFAVAFVDVRMPPGIDGVATAARLWTIDPDIQVVLCTAYADHSWRDMTQLLGHPDRWVLLRKPFDNVEVLQLAHALTAKWSLLQQNRLQLADLESRVERRTNELLKAMNDLKRETSERSRSEEERRTLERRFEETQRLESLGVLAGGIAHDFNNILTGILGSASLARLEIAPGSAMDKHLQRIEKSSCRAAELCEQMLAFAGKGQVSLRTIDMNAMVRDTLELLHASVPKDATLSLDLAPVLPPILGDPSRMRQIVMNLVINAAEALAGPPRRVTLVTKTCTLSAGEIAKMVFPGEARPGEYVCIEVSDTGAGMAAETMRRIFEPFYTTKFTGRGLGLCAVQGIIRSRSGALDVSTELGKGSRFRAYFPITSANRSAPAPVLPGALQAVPAGTTVLIVDDEAPVRDIAAAALSRQGYQTLTAANGAEAVSLLQKTTQPLCGVLLDLTMPELDGVSTLHALRALRPGLKAVLMSGYDQNDAVRRFTGLGLSGFLQKPFTVDTLREKVALLRTSALLSKG